MSNRNSSAEPSMEQILESISDIIADTGEDGQQALPEQNGMMPVSHAPVPLGNVPFDNRLQAQPVSTNPVNGSLTDRLANMDQPLEMRPVPDAETQTPPNFMGQPVVQNEYIEPMSVNMPVPQMTPHQPALNNGGFPVESAEDFLANNAQPGMQQPQQMPASVPQPEFFVNPEHIPAMQQPASQQPPIEQASIQQPVVQQPVTPQSVVQQQPVEVMPVPVAVADTPIAPPVMVQDVAPVENVVMQPNEVTATVPDALQPSATHDVLNSFKQAEEQAIASSEMTTGVVPEAGLLDASYIPATDSAPLVAEPIGIHSPVPNAAIDQNAVGMDNAQLEAAASAVVTEGLATQPAEVSSTEAATTQQPIDSGFEGAVREMMKPMVKEWLDANLSKLVEDVVRSELTAALTKK